jgi:excisionase family DNA binding protein
MKEEQALLRPADVAPLLGVSASRVYQLLSSGVLPSIRVGGAIRIPRAAWHAWLEEQKDRALGAVRPDGGS